MPRLTTIQASHTYGVLDPHAIERRDTKFVQASLSDGDNIVLLPQGGYTDRGGTTDAGRIRRRLTAITVTSGMITLPNGGTAADLLNANLSITTSAASTSRFVVVEVDFGAPTAVTMIDAGGIFIATTPADGALIAEYWNGSAWAAFGAPAKITLSALSRRIAVGGPGTAPITANLFRLAIDATTAAGAVTLKTIHFHVESATASAAIERDYAPEQGQAHQYVVTQGNIDMFEGATWRAAIDFPCTEAMLRAIKFETKYDTILAFHQDLRPQQILRLSSSTEWACDPIPFTNIPRADYGEVYTNGVNAVQEVFTYNILDTEKFDLLVEGETTTAITNLTSDVPATVAAIKAALEALPNVSPGLTVTPVTGSENRAWTIEFTGEGNANRPWLVMSGTALDDDGYIRIRNQTKGKEGGEDIMSATRGWPAFGRFAQQRLVMGGLKSRPNDILASVTGEPFNLNTEIDIATAAFSYEVPSANKMLRDLIVTRTLVFMGDKQVVYMKNQTLSASEVPQFGVSDAPGIKQIVPPVSSDNALYYIQEGGSTLRQLAYTELEQNYVGDNASVLSAFLIRDPVDMTRRRATSGIDSDLIIMANANGTMTALTMMRTQEVSGFAPWSTDGEIVSVSTDDANDTWWLVRREIDGVDEVRREKMEPDKLLDEAREFTYGTPTNVITGLSAFNGREVWAVADDRVFGPFTVASGQIDIGADYATLAIRVGTWRPPLAVDPPVSLEEETRARQARLKRVNRARLSVIDTTSVAISANGGAVAALPLRSNQDTILDEGPLARPFSGTVEAEGMHGFTDHGKLTVTQTYPGTLTVRSVAKNIAA